MGRRLRYIPPGGCLVEVTNRTIQGRFLLRPGNELNKLVIGVLGRAQRLYRVEIHACIVLSNHYHLLLSVESAYQLAQFMAYFQGNLAKEAGRIYKWRGPFWHRRYQHVVVSDEERAQVSRLRYILENGCKEGLVASPRDWPGVSSVQALLGGKRLKGEWIDRTRQRQASSGPGAETGSQFRDCEVVNLTPLPCWQSVRPRLRRERVQKLVAEIEAETRVRQQTEGTEPAGVEKVLSHDPHQRSVRSKWSPAPMFHCDSEVAHDLLKRAYAAFNEAFRRASRLWKRGDLGAEFPEGAFAPPIALQHLPQVAG